MRTNWFSEDNGPGNLSRVVAYLITAWPKRMTRTELVKAVFFFEYLHYDQHKCSFTEATFVRDNYGPNDPLVYETAKHPPFVEESYQGPLGLAYQYKVSDADRAREYTEELPGYVSELLSVTVRTLSELRTASAIKDYVYQLPPMLEILREEATLGYSLSGKRIDMSQRATIFRPTKAQLDAARQRVDQSSRGSDEDYHHVLMTELEEYRVLRERALGCLDME